MHSSAREATLLSLIVVGVVFALGLTRFGWGLGGSAVGAIFVAAVSWLAVYAVTKGKDSARPWSRSVRYAADGAVLPNARPQSHVCRSECQSGRSPDQSDDRRSFSRFSKSPSGTSVRYLIS